MTDLHSRPPQQARSRKTMQRLLNATITVIAQKGLARVTIPEIAAAAELSIGSVYRRFTDKDALIRAAFIQLLESAHTANQASLTPDLFQGLTLDQAVGAICRALVAQYQGREALLKALDQYLDIQTDALFRERAVDLIAANLRQVVEVLLLFRDRIASKSPEQAITFALLSASTVIEAHKLQMSVLWRRMLPLDDAALADRAAQAMIAYLTAPQA